MADAKVSFRNLKYRKKVKRPKRKVERIGVSLLKGGLGKSHVIKFRGKTYYHYRDAFVRGTSLFNADGSEMKDLVKRLRRDGYKVRLTRATPDGAVVNVYTNPAVPWVPHKRLLYG